ncbi:MAG: LysM peptidoglycan-binding domain-containing protein [Anaerolineae bacterium]|nr:LysM peptidoglycan-binding domain-containing protein [Anaerolineae bacterium]
MTSAARLAGILAIGFLFLGAVIGSIFLAQADSLMTIPPSVGGWTLPTPTLFPTAPPREPVLSRPTPTETAATPESVQVEATATGEPERICEIPEGWVYYTVQPGDTFYSLAERAGTTLPALLDGNCKPAAYELQVGEALYVPAMALTVPTSIPFVCTRPPGWQVAIVRRGDTFSSLARRYGIALSVLLSMNCRDSSNTALYAGQTIYVPPRAVPPVWPVWPTPLPTALPTWLPPTETLPPPPTATPTPVPTNTPIPSPTPTPTETPVLVPTWTPTPPDWELPTAGPPPTSGPSPTPTPDPALTPTPEATATGEPAPTVTPSVEPTPEDPPSPTPEPTTEAPLIPAPLPTATETPVPEPLPTDPPATEPPEAPPVVPTPTTAP